MALWLTSPCINRLCIVSAMQRRVLYTASQRWAGFPFKLSSECFRCWCLRFYTFFRVFFLTLFSLTFLPIYFCLFFNLGNGFHDREVEKRISEIDQGSFCFFLTINFIRILIIVILKRVLHKGKYHYRLQLNFVLLNEWT